MDENTKKKRCMDVARILYRSSTHEIVNRVMTVNIKNVHFSIKLVEDWYGPMQWLTSPILTSLENGSDEGAGESDSDDSEALEEGEIFEDIDVDNYNNNYTMISHGVANMGNGEVPLERQVSCNEVSKVQCTLNALDEEKFKYLESEAGGGK